MVSHLWKYIFCQNKMQHEASTSNEQKDEQSLSTATAVAEQPQQATVAITTIEAQAQTQTAIIESASSTIIVATPHLDAAAAALAKSKEQVSAGKAEIDKLSDEQVDEKFGKVLVKSKPYNLYYADHKKKWSQRATDKGYTLLQQLLRKGVQAMQFYAAALQSSNLNVEEEIKNGFNLYSRKPSKNVIGETWSREEYHFPGLLYQYVRFKSMQRFTESYSLLQRAYDQGMLDSISGMTRVRFVSFGGGPGFELYAVRVFLNEHFPHVQVELTSQDLEEQWEHTAHILDCKFVHGSFYDEKLVTELAQNHEFGIASYVVYHYLREKPDILHRIVSQPSIKFLFCNERFEKMELYDNLTSSKYGLKATPLIDQSKGRDDRLMVLCKQQEQQPLVHKDKLETVFVNVPYEEHKDKKQKSRHYNNSSGSGSGNSYHGRRDSYHSHHSGSHSSSRSYYPDHSSSSSSSSSHYGNPHHGSSSHYQPRYPYPPPPPHYQQQYQQQPPPQQQHYHSSSSSNNNSGSSQQQQDYRKKQYDSSRDRDDHKRKRDY